MLKWGKEGDVVYILKVLVEHPTHSLDTTFDYLSYQSVQVGCRVKIKFGYQHIIGYVDGIQKTSSTKEELEKENGFTYYFIEDVIDKNPLLNQELRELADYLAHLTLSPRISCLQAMLPPQLKPSTNRSVGIVYQTVVNIKNVAPVKTPKQKEALEYIKNHPGLTVKEYPYSQSLLDNLKKQNAIEYTKKEVYRDPYQGEEKKTVDFSLTDDQQKVVHHILNRINQHFTCLLHGVTGSGKTEVYLQLSKFVIQQGKTVLMMVPEISLTPMMVKAFKSRFGKDVAIIHSKLSSGERYDEYRRIANGKVKIVVGARSAVFAPLEHIGLIIMDEEHDASYKQETKPRYLTSQVARIRGKTHRCPVVLGSATPSLESYSRALKGIYDLCELPHRINQNPLPKIELIDMAEEIRKKNYSLFSDAMKQKIQDCLDHHQQVILLLNKRGYANYMRCLDCGEVIKCPHCDVTLTYHKSQQKLKCHYCDYSTKVLSHCPYCGSDHLKMVGTGTQKIEEQIEQTFCHAKVIRYDVDSTKNKGGHLKLLEKFEKQEANVLVGTQMIAKGLDFENVTFVGVLNADISLNIPDYRANERTFQLLEQVSGRSGRGKLKGTVMIQTYNPDHFVLQCVKNHDYQKFYHQEMKSRKIGQYPPFTYLISIVVQGKKEENVSRCSEEIKYYLQQHLNHASILGPANCTIYKMQDMYRKRITIKVKNSQKIYPLLENINDYYNKKGRKVHVVCDLNPYASI